MKSHKGHYLGALFAHQAAPGMWILVPSLDPVGGKSGVGVIKRREGVIQKKTNPKVSNNIGRCLLAR